MVGICFDSGLQKLWNVMVMVLKGIPVYLVAVYDVFYGNFTIWFFFQQLPESIRNCTFDTIHPISSHSKHISENYSINGRIRQKE